MAWAFMLPSVEAEPRARASVPDSVACRHTRRRRALIPVKVGPKFIAPERYYRADSRGQARQAFYHFRCRWRDGYPTRVRRLEKKLPERLSFFSFPRHLWRKLRTTNVIERLFVEVRRHTRPMVCFVNVKSVDRIIYSIFHRFNLEWKNRTLQVFTQAA